MSDCIWERDGYENSPTVSLSIHENKAKAEGINEIQMKHNQN